ncbi:hypothetical protein A9Q98_03680 [Thalassotalea sp. 42_200_T64]|nr:hypothetical protein A9Q98_03680 [Thalassotalea sp. 42_200_T64]
MYFLFFIFFLWIIKEENQSNKYIEIRNTGLFKITAFSLPAVGFLFCMTTIQTMMVMESYKVGGFKNHRQLDSITNPISWSQYINVTVHTRALMHGFENKNPKALISYIHWD